MNLFKTNINGFQETIKTISKVIIDSDREERITISNYKTDAEKEVSFHRIESDERLKKNAKCHSTFGKIVNSAMTFLSDFNKDYDSSSDYIDERTDDEFKKRHQRKL